MKLSLVIPNYNNSQYLEDCLNSVVAQTYQPYEIIVADDASTDRSREIIESYTNRYSHIRAIYHSRNHGVSLNRHDAILQAVGDYITTLDSDDYYHDDGKLESEIKLISEYQTVHHKDIIAYSNIVLVDVDKRGLHRVYNGNNTPRGRVFVEFLTMRLPQPRDFIMRKEQYLRVGGFDPNIPIYEDWDLKIKLASQYEFYYTGNPGTAYRQHGHGLSSAPFFEHMEWLKKIFKSHIRLLDGVEKDKATRDFHLYLLKLYMDKDGMVMQEKLLLKSIAFHLEPDRRNRDKEREIQYRLDQLDHEKTVVIYGAGEHTAMLLECFDLDGLDILYIVDRDKRWQRDSLLGFDIKAPEAIAITQPDAIIISSFRYQNRIKDDLKKSLHYDGEVITLYNEKDQAPFYCDTNDAAMR